MVYTSLLEQSISNVSKDTHAMCSKRLASQKKYLETQLCAALLETVTTAIISEQSSQVIHQFLKPVVVVPDPLESAYEQGIRVPRSITVEDTRTNGLSRTMRVRDEKPVDTASLRALVEAEKKETAKFEAYLRSLLNRPF